MKSESTKRHNFVWAVISVIGIALIIYGCFLFVVMPAAGVFVAMLGLCFIKMGLEKTKRNIQKSDRNLKKTLFLNSDYGKESTLSNKFLCLMIYFTNLVLLSLALPNFRKIIGENLGFVIGGLITFTSALFLTGLILSIFRSYISRILIIVIVWCPIIVRIY
jgi:hypothetical protein